MRHLRAGELAADLLQELPEAVGALGNERLQRRDRDRRVRPVRQDLRRALEGQMLIAHQIDPQRPDPRAITHRRGDAGRERRAGQMPTLAAALLDPVLHAVKPRHLRQVEHLPRPRLHDRRIRQISRAALAPLDRVQHRPIGILAALQMMTAMPGLAARLATRTTPQAPLLLVRRRLRVPIRRRRLGRVPRVLIQLRAQLRDQRLKLGDPRRLLGYQRLELGIRRAA